MTRGLTPILFLFVAGTPAADATEDKPRLLVLVVFDQLRGDYLTRWEAQFGEGGFARLREGGAWFPECHFPYGGTWTAAGHASILAGCSPAVHGIVGNDWYDRAAGKTVYCVDSPRYQQVPPPPGKGGSGSATPEAMKAPTFADSLKRVTDGEGRVVALSLKDRSAVLPAGHRPDACYWFDDGTGTFVTSSYYRAAPHPWAEEYNDARPADRWFGKDWTRYKPELDYAQFADPDDAPGEGTGSKQGRTFPHPMTGGLKSPGKAYYRAVYTSPFGNDLLLDFTKKAVVAEGLGSDDVPDLLVVSFSSNDAVGHAWGPDSREVLDVTLRTDGTMKDLLDFLDERVGKGKYLLALTADHGVCPTPESARARGLDADRVDVRALLDGAEAHLSETFGDDRDEPRWIEGRSNEWLFLDLDYLRKRGLAAAKVRRELADWLAKQPGVADTFTRGEVADPGESPSPLLKRMALSFYPERSGDVAVVVKPYHLFGSPFNTGTTHGSPHPYDTHVPLLLYGTGVRPGEHKGEVSPTCVAAVFAEALGIAPPAKADAGVPKGLFDVE